MLSTVVTCMDLVPHISRTAAGLTAMRVIRRPLLTEIFHQRRRHRRRHPANCPNCIVLRHQLPGAETRETWRYSVYIARDALWHSSVLSLNHGQWTSLAVGGCSRYREPVRVHTAVCVLFRNQGTTKHLRPVARGFDWFDRTPFSRQQYMYTCNCCGTSSKLPNISVKIYNGICTKMSHFKWKSPKFSPQTPPPVGRGRHPTPHLAPTVLWLNPTLPPSGMSGYGPASAMISELTVNMLC